LLGCWSMGPMTEFFSQSGYSIGFLKFIIIAELFGAIVLLLKMSVLWVLWTMRAREKGERRSFRRALITAGSVVVATLVIAVGGKRALAKSNSAAPQTVVPH